MTERGIRAAVRLLFVLAVAFGALVPAGQAHGQASLADRLARVAEGRADLGGATVAVSVRDAGTGATLFAQAADAPLLPASNMKLLTTGAAAIVLGADMFFETELRLRDGDLVVVGSGDPGLGDPDLLHIDGDLATVDEFLDGLADAVAARAGGEIDEIIVDDRIFDRVATHPSWSSDQLNRWYQAEVAGVNFFTNVLTFYFEAGGAGGTPALTVEPRVSPMASWMTMDNAADAVAAGQSTVWIARPTPENRFRAFGDVRAGTTAMVHVAVHEPQRVFANLLGERLRARGVRVGAAGDPARAVRLARATEDLTGGAAAARIRTSLADALARANGRSQNLYTEAMIKRIGHEVTGEPGSWENGAAVIRMLLTERVGPRHAVSTSIADGSGLSRENRVTAATLTAWLAAMLEEPPRLRGVFVNSLPTPGVGTLRNRFAGAELAGEVRAKTGTIGGVRCLSGYVFAEPGAAGDAIAFSVLVNDLSGGRAVRAARQVHEDVVEEIDAWLARRVAASADFGG